jgi:hypothetical protein
MLLFPEKDGDSLATFLELCTTMTLSEVSIHQSAVLQLWISTSFFLNSIQLKYARLKSTIPAQIGLFPHESWLSWRDFEVYDNAALWIRQVRGPT